MEKYGKMGLKRENGRNGEMEKWKNNGKDLKNGKNGKKNGKIEKRLSFISTRPDRRLPQSRAGWQGL